VEQRDTRDLTGARITVAARRIIEAREHDLGPGAFG